jgi:hypothetical protein
MRQWHEVRNKEVRDLANKKGVLGLTCVLLVAVVLLLLFSSALVWYQLVDCATSVSIRFLVGHAFRLPALSIDECALDASQLARIENDLLMASTTALPNQDPQLRTSIETTEKNHYGKTFAMYPHQVRKHMSAPVQALCIKNHPTLIPCAFPSLLFRLIPSVCWHPQFNFQSNSRNAPPRRHLTVIRPPLPWSVLLSQDSFPS